MRLASSLNVVQHHATNMAAVSIPIMSILLDAPLVVTFITSLLGAIYYGMLIWSWLVNKSWKRKP